MLLRTLVTLAAAGAVVSGCGGSGGGPGSPTSPGSTTSTKVTHADPVALLPVSGQVSGVIRPTSAPTGHDQVLNFDTLSPSFATAYVRARKLASGAAGIDLAGPRGSHLYVRVFVFGKLAAAGSLWKPFQDSTRLRTAVHPPPGAPGEQRAASVQAYCPHRSCLSFRYAFREQNVLAYVELDGPRAAHTLADAVRIAGVTDTRIRRSLR